MAENKDTDARPNGAANEGEGNKTEDRRYVEGATAHARGGTVDDEARAAADALDGDEGEALRRAEEAGRSHTAGEDPILHEKGWRPGDKEGT